jgi:hypothetical protein
MLQWCYDNWIRALWLWIDENLTFNDYMGNGKNVLDKHKKKVLNINIMAQAYHTSSNSRQMLTALIQKRLYCSGRVNYIVMSWTFMPNNCLQDLKPPC